MKTTHNLEFEAAPWDVDPSIALFRIGTCEGQWQVIGKAYVIISILNKESGNGHLDDVFEWFEHSAKRDGMGLIVAAVMNARFKEHLLKKRGFMDMGMDSVIKIP
jgi:hypothetical protein